MISAANIEIEEASYERRTFREGRYWILARD